MLYPENIESKLGFDKIRELVRAECLSSLGQAFVDKIRFSNQYETIDKLTRQTEEFCQILTQDEGFPQAHYLDVSESLSRALPENSFLTEAELFDLKLSLLTILDCLKFFRRRGAEQYPHLRELTLEVMFDPSLTDKIALVIDERGRLRDNASFELRRIRQQIIQEQSQLRKRLEQILKAAKQEGYTPDDANLTLRDGRMVIPLVAEHKRRIKGIVHDESATGQTVFLEPTEIIDLNNNIRELEYAERREIIRILTELTNAVRPQISGLRKAYHFLGLMDFIRAKARFALKINALNPSLEKKPLLKWWDSRHPLLQLSLEAQGKKIVPLTIELSPEHRILLISGPNAGGKSVALKTVGLLQYMYQCGLLIPVGEGSRVGVFRDIFVDMGDEQSIENDLSTYSSHLKNMKYFTEFADSKSLLLIDEFGTGTEPQMGGAIAEAILDKLNRAKVFGVITTHYANLKVFAEHNSGVVNGAMQYDGKHLEPLYTLEIGKPGSSFAFEIARKIGLAKPILDKARQTIGLEQVDYDRLLAELDGEKKYFAKQNQLLAEKEKRYAELVQDYERLHASLEADRKRLLNQARAEAKEIVRAANQRIEQTIRQIREAQADKETTKQLRQELAQYQAEALQSEEISLVPSSISTPSDKKTSPKKIQTSAGSPEDAPIMVLDEPIGIGDRVRVKGQTTIGEVITLKGNMAEISIGELKSSVKLSRLEKISRREAREIKREASNVALNMNEKMLNFTTQLDLRGKRGEEALTELQTFLDDAILLSAAELRIVHGKGDGILRKLVREQLRQYKEVKAMQDEHADRGGDGVTIVILG